MVVQVVGLTLLLLSCTSEAHRDRDSSSSKAAAHLGATSSAAAKVNSMSASATSEARAREHERHMYQIHRSILDECLKAKQAHEEGKDTKETVRLLGGCITQLKQFQEGTEKERKKSENANAAYAEDIVYAQKILKFLKQKVDYAAQEFTLFQKKEDQQHNQLKQLMGQEAQRSSSLLQGGTLRNVVPLAAQQTERLGAIRAAQQWGNMAAMFTPQGQNFAAQPSGNGQQPSLLQLGVPLANPWMHAAGADLQAKLDREAERLSENEAAVFQGPDGDPDDA